MFWMILTACTPVEPLDVEEPTWLPDDHHAVLAPAPKYGYHFEGGESFEVSMPDYHDWLQHHATVALSRKGDLIVVWTLGRFVHDPESWMRVVHEDGESWGLLRLNRGLAEAAPDVVMSGRGYAVVAGELPGGMGVEIVNITNMTSVDAFLIAGPSEADGENRADIMVTPEDGVLVGWYSGGGNGNTGTHYIGGLEADFGDIIPPRPVGYSNHFKTQPPDLAMMPNSEVAFAWTDVDAFNSNTADITRVMVSRIDAEQNVIGTTLLHEARPGPPLAARPGVVANEKGNIAVTWQMEPNPGSGHLQAVLATLDADGNPIAPMFPIAPIGSKRPTMRIVDQDNILVSYDYMGAIWAALWTWEGQPITVPVRLSPPGANALRSSLAIQRLNDDTWQVAATWEQTIGDQPQQVWATSGRIHRTVRN